MPFDRITADPDRMNGQPCIQGTGLTVGRLLKVRAPYADQGLPRTAAPLLREVGINTLHGGEFGLGQPTDNAIPGRAACDGPSGVTLDADFHAALPDHGAAEPSVLRLRIGGLMADALARLVLRLLAACSDILEKGGLATFAGDRLRVRRLPIGRA